MFHPVILIGGSGSRLWPLSRAARPKQLLPLISAQRTMLQETMARLENLVGCAASVVICNERHRFLVAEQLLEIEAAVQTIMLEPQARNTAAAIAVAALHLAAQNPAAVMLVLAADQVITDVAAFHRAVARASTVARVGHIAILGVVPDKPETGFGYIQQGPAIEELCSPKGFAYAIARFVEKPDLPTAEAYLQSGDYLWNSGIFMARADVMVRELETYAPKVLWACRRALEEASRDADFLRLNAPAFGECPAIAIDYAVLEKTECAAVLPVEMGWSDIGSWTALWELAAKDDAGNAPSGDVMLRDARNCLVNAQSRLVVALGVHDLIVVETADAVLVAHQNQAQNVKQIVEELQKHGRQETED